MAALEFPQGEDERKSEARVSFPDRRQRSLYSIKSKLHQEVIDRIDLELLVKVDSDTARREVARLVAVL